MNLDTANSIYKNVTEAQVREVFRDERLRGEFSILLRSKWQFIQAAGEDDDGYILEYRDGEGKDCHFRAAGEYTKAQVEQAFIHYLNNDNRWFSDFTWQKYEIKPWWKFW